MRISAENIVRAIKRLPERREYEYINSRTPRKIAIHNVCDPEGPILFKRYDPSKERLADVEVNTISPPMIWRVANAILPERPFNIDRILGASYNTRSVLESLIAHTPLFYSCMPGRIEMTSATKRTKPGHKHLIYLPEDPHENGVLGFKNIDMAVSEIAIDVAVYERISLEAADPSENMSIEEKRRHAQIQIALVLIGQQLGFRTWVASNDRNIEYKGKRIAEFESVVDNLTSERVLSAYPDAANAARLIDCVWFKNGRAMPAVMEIEHSTGVTSGLSRMNKFYNTSPQLRDIRWTIVAPDNNRQKVINLANEEQFRGMEPKFFPYSAVEELFSLCSRRKPQGVTDQFLDCYMENCVA